MSTISSECDVIGCFSPLKSSKQKYCIKHYWRWIRHGSTELKIKIYELQNGHCLQCGLDLKDPEIWINEWAWSRFFCTLRCYKRYYRSRTEEPIECVVCETLIPSTAVSTKKYCSDECSRAARKPSNYDGTDIVSGKSWLLMLEFYGDECANPKHSDSPGKFGRISKDHVLPLSKGGSHTIDNIQPLCLQCNIVKGTNHRDYRWDKGMAFMKYLETQNV